MCGRPSGDKQPDLPLADCDLAHAVEIALSDESHTSSDTLCAVNELIWIADCVAPSERASRIASLHRVCDRLLQLEPAQRPRTLRALKRMMPMRRALCVRSYTVHPRSIASAIDPSPEVHHLLAHIPVGCGEEVLEQPTEDYLKQLRCKWTQLVRDDWPARNGVRATAEWIASQAYVSREHEAEEAVLVLSKLGLLRYTGGEVIECGGLSHDLCRTKLPPVPDFPVTPWEIPWGFRKGVTATKREVPVPPGCVGLLIGKKGRALQALQQGLAGQIRGPHWGEELAGSDACPSFHLHVTAGTGRYSSGILIVTIKWIIPWQHKAQEPKRVRDAADCAAKILIRHMSEIRCCQMHESFIRRERQQERLREIGQAYHKLRHEQRTERRRRPLEAVERALTLPPASLPVAHFCGRKELARQRRRGFQREKRVSLLHACDVLERVVRVSPAYTEASFSDQERYQELLSASHLSRMCVANHERSKQSVADRRMVCSVRRVQRHIKAFAKVTERPTCIAGSGIVDVIGFRHGKRRRVRNKHCLGNRDADLAEGLDICLRSNEKTLCFEDVLRMRISKGDAFRPVNNEELASTAESDQAEDAEVGIQLHEATAEADCYGCKESNE